MAPPATGDGKAKATLSEEDVIDQALKAAYAYAGAKKNEEPQPSLAAPDGESRGKRAWNQQKYEDEREGGRSVVEEEEGDLGLGDGDDEEGSGHVLHDKRVLASNSEGKDVGRQVMVGQHAYEGRRFAVMDLPLVVSGLNRFMCVPCPAQSLH